MHPRRNDTDPPHRGDARGERERGFVGARRGAVSEGEVSVEGSASCNRYRVGSGVGECGGEAGADDI